MSNQLQFCKRCLYGTSHPLGLVIDHEGICSGCRVHEEKDTLDWNSRWEELKELIAPYRTRHDYDCIIPISGGQDSHFIVYLVKEKLGLNPLLVSYNKYFNTEIGIQNLANLRIKFDCDIVYQNVNPVNVKAITRTSLRTLGSIYWPILAGQTVFPVQTAIRYKIPLIIWGAHQGLEQVGMFSHLHNVEMSRRYRADHDLMGHEASQLLSPFDLLKERNIWQYRYPSDQEIAQSEIRGIYLGNYVRWDPKAQHESMIKKYAYQTASFSRTFDCYDYVDCFNYMDLHDLIKLYKHGYSKVTDHATREIRFGRLSREEGLALVRKHEQAPLQHLNAFCQWLGITPLALEFILDQHRHPDFWSELSPKNWEFKGWSTRHNASSLSSTKKNLGFKVNNQWTKNNKYITFGKGV